MFFLSVNGSGARCCSLSLNSGYFFIFIFIKQMNVVCGTLPPLTQLKAMNNKKVLCIYILIALLTLIEF